MKNIMADYHMHTTISPDGANSMEEMCEQALRKGIQEIAFTDHFEIYTPDFKGSDYSPLNRFTLDYLKAYQKNFERCKKTYGDKLVIKSGIELGQPQVNTDFSQQVLDIMPFDFVLGSMHKIDNTDLSEFDYTLNQNEHYCEINLEYLFELVNTQDFDCLGHVDLIKRYAARQGKLVTLMDYPAELSTIFKRLIVRGKGIEINTSGLRQGMGEPIPCFEMLKFYRELGGEILTIGSDAHCKNDIAADFDLVYQMAIEAGFHRIALYTKRKCSFYEIG